MAAVGDAAAISGFGDASGLGPGATPGFGFATFLALTRLAGVVVSVINLASRDAAAGSIASDRLALSTGP